MREAGQDGRVREQARAPHRIEIHADERVVLRLDAVEVCELGVHVRKWGAEKRLDVAGPLPDALQSYTVFHAGVSAGSKHSASAKSLADFLTKPEAKAVFKAKGQEPG